MRIKSVIANCLLLVTSITLGVLMSEAGSRLLLDPSDYLSVNTVPDEMLGIRVAQGASGFDEWGFRNRGVPPAADIVAIGDSHTYGNNATMSDSWPHVAARATGLKAYNLGLGGYGPNQYYYLLKTHALKLKPRWVLTGLYMGDDFENAFLMTYGMSYWSDLRKGDWTGVDAHIWEEASDGGSPLANVRNWLSRKSLIYRLVIHGPILGNLKGAVQINRAAARHDAMTTILAVPDANIHEAFRPTAIRDRLDLNSGPVREGMRITFELLKRMNEICRQSGAQMVVVVIPTKELVFADYLLRDREIHLHDVIEQLVTNEESARRQLFEFLDEAAIPHVDTLPALHAAVSNRLYTRSDRDMHPAKNGYKVIGDAAAQFLVAADKRRVD